MTKERVIEALGLLDQAITADRHYAPALSWAAICHMQLVRDGWTEEPETSHQTGINLARRALEVGETTRRSSPMPRLYWRGSARTSAR